MPLFLPSIISITLLHKQINMARPRWFCPSDLGAKLSGSVIATTGLRNIAQRLDFYLQASEDAV